MKLSIHQTLRGRPIKMQGPDGRHIMTYDGQKINLGYGWVNIEDDWPAVFDAITVDGFATSAELASDHRDDANFVSRQLIMVDIDSGMTIGELFEDNFYNNYGAGFYTTPSHRDDAHRFRIMFRTETAITDREAMKRLNRSLLRIYSAGDIACKDSTRIFFGTIEAPLREYRETILPDAVVAELLMMEDLFQTEAQQSEREFIDERDFAPASIDDVAGILDELRKYYTDLTYVDRRTVTWAVVAAVGKQAAIDLMRPRWNDHDKTMSYEGFVTDHKRNAIGLGTVVEMIRRHNPLFRKNNKDRHEIEYNRYVQLQKDIELIKKIIERKRKI